MKKTTQNKVVAVRLTTTEHKALTTFCKKTGVTRSGFFRHLFYGKLMKGTKEEKSVRD